MVFLVARSVGGDHRLMYAHNTSGSWQVSPVDDGGWSGTSPVLLLDEGNNMVHLVYGGIFALWHTSFAMGYSE